MTEERYAPEEEAPQGKPGEPENTEVDAPDEATEGETETQEEQEGEQSA